MAQYVDTLLKIFPVLAAVAAGVWTVRTYYDNLEQTNLRAAAEKAKEQRVQLLQAQQPFLEHQWKAYVEASKVVGALAALDPSDPEWEKARKRFWELWTSELAMVETPDVAKAMADFSDLLPLVTGQDQNAAKTARAKLRTAALLVAHALGDSVKASWAVPNAATP